MTTITEKDKYFIAFKQHTKSISGAISINQMGWKKQKETPDMLYPLTRRVGWEQI